MSGGSEKDAGWMRKTREEMDAENREAMQRLQDESSDLVEFQILQRKQFEALLGVRKELKNVTAILMAVRAALAGFDADWTRALVALIDEETGKHA